MAECYTLLHFQAVLALLPFVSDDQHGNSLPLLFPVNGPVMPLFDIVFLLLRFITFISDQLPVRLPKPFLKCKIIILLLMFYLEYKVESWTVANEQNWHYLILWETFCKYSLSEINKFKLKDLSEVTSWNARNTTRAIWSRVQKVCSFLKTKYQIIWCRLFISKFRIVVIQDPLSSPFSQNSRCHWDF